MHAMGPNVAGVLGSAVAAGLLLALLGGGVQYPSSPVADRLMPRRLSGAFLLLKRSAWT